MIHSLIMAQNIVTSVSGARQASMLKSSNPFIEWFTTSRTTSHNQSVWQEMRIKVSQTIEVDLLLTVLGIPGNSKYLMFLFCVSQCKPWTLAVSIDLKTMNNNSI